MQHVTHVTVHSLGALRIGKHPQRELYSIWDDHDGRWVILEDGLEAFDEALGRAKALLKRIVGK